MYRNRHTCNDIMRSREEIEKEVNARKDERCIEDFQCDLLYMILEVVLDIRDINLGLGESGIIRGNANRDLINLCDNKGL